MGIFSISLSTVYLLFKNIQKRFLEILDTKSIFFGVAICPIAFIYSNCGMPSIKSKIIAWSLCGVFSFATAAAKFNFELGLLIISSGCLFIIESSSLVTTLCYVDIICIINYCECGVYYRYSSCRNTRTFQVVIF